MKHDYQWQPEGHVWISKNVHIGVPLTHLYRHGIVTAYAPPTAYAPAMWRVKVHEEEVNDFQGGQVDLGEAQVAAAIQAFDNAIEQAFSNRKLYYGPMLWREGGIVIESDPEREQLERELIAEAA